MLRGVDGKRTLRGRQRRPGRRRDPGRLPRDDAGPAGQLAELTIDRDLQFEVQQILGEQMAAGEGATSARPSCSTSRPARCWPRPATRPTTRPNPATSTPADRDDAATGCVVDPGSVHKAIIFGAALQEGVITPDTTGAGRPDASRKGDTTFTDTHPQPNGTQDDHAGHPRLLVQRRHDHDRRQARRAASCTSTSSSSGSGSRPARACRASRPGWCSRRTSWSGSTLRLGPDRA